MNRQNKPLLFVIAGLVAACLVIGSIGYMATRAFMSNLADFASDDPGLVAQMGRSIAFFDLPPGFGEGRAVSNEMFTLVTYTGPHGRSHLTLFQVPPTIHVDHMSLQGLLDDVTLTSGQETLVIEQRTIELRGHEAAVTISEGEGAHGTYRSATVFFDGLGGPALVNFSAPLPEWDDQVVETFFASLH